MFILYIVNIVYVHPIEKELGTHVGIILMNIVEEAIQSSAMGGMKSDGMLQSCVYTVYTDVSLLSKLYSCEIQLIYV